MLGDACEPGKNSRHGRQHPSNKRKANQGVAGTTSSSSMWRGSSSVRSPPQRKSLQLAAAPKRKAFAIAAAPAVHTAAAASNAGAALLPESSDPDQWLAEGGMQAMCRLGQHERKQALQQMQKDSLVAVVEAQLAVTQKATMQHGALKKRLAMKNQQLRRQKKKLEKLQEQLVLKVSGRDALIQASGGEIV